MRKLHVKHPYTLLNVKQQLGNVIVKKKYSEDLNNILKANKLSYSSIRP